MMDEQVRVTCEWNFYDENERLLAGPFSNSVSPDGAEAIAALLEAVSAPYLVIGSDTTSGWVITEVFRKACSSVTREGALVRFRTQLLTTEAVGDYEKASIYINGTSVSGTGTMLNLLVQSFSHGAYLLTIEAKFTVAGG